MASSHPIAAGEDYTADDINNLRSDVLDTTSGHKHDGSNGAKVPFSNLDVTTGTAGTAPPTGGTKSYNDLANHVSSSQGQHGMNASVHVAGAGTAATQVQAGTSTMVGSSKTVTFPIAFSGNPQVVVTMYTQPGSGGYDEQGPWITARSATEFTVAVRGDWAGANFGWVAIGVKNA